MCIGHLDDAHTLAVQALTLARERQERGNEAYALKHMPYISSVGLLRGVMHLQASTPPFTTSMP